MKLKIGSLALLFAFLCNLNVTAQTRRDFKNTNFSELSSHFQELLSANSIVGGQLWMLKDGEVIFKDHYGQSNLEKDRSMDDQTIFHWASITKTFTAIGIMQLRDRGLLSLEDKVTDYLPELRKVHNPYGSMDDISLYHLMTHSAGFRGATWPWREHDWQPLNAQTWEQLEHTLAFSKIHFKPGSQWMYSNPGVTFLGMIIERLTNDDFEYYIQKNIFTPLGLSETFFDRAPWHLQDRVAQSYLFDKAGNRTEAIFDLDTEITVSNGGLNCTFGDMSKYLNFLLGYGDNGLYDAVLKRSSLEEMFIPRIKTGRNTEHMTEWQSLMFFMEDFEGMKVNGHSGWQNGFHTHIYFDTSKDLAFVFGFNSTGPTNRAMDRQLTNHIFFNYLKPLYE